jgi:hypothetical protein
MKEVSNLSGFLFFHLDYLFLAIKWNPFDSVWTLMDFFVFVFVDNNWLIFALWLL